ncbi:site-specific integrase [Acanthopleuribacter pedis]|uniref:Integrase family protein n=1 Tax=Acanthopleuribacter pedis TaxID=442870 RepID=A0A8J7QN55_9BACT|nr:tyrosine-type recombinase/integrase [Acanthopleuribacter pedis]MBO1322310.1 integrase family protein [Acanthopleuribacter pedis]
MRFALTDVSSFCRTFVGNCKRLLFTESQNEIRTARGWCMNIQKIRFNVDNLRPFIKAGVPVTIKDSAFKGLKFTIGKSKMAFTFDKRVSGRKGSALTFSMRAVVGPHNAVNYKEAREWAAELKRLCEAGIDPREDEAGRKLLGLPPLLVNRSKSSGANPVLLMDDAVKVFFSKKTYLKATTLHSLARNINEGFDPSWLKLDIREISPAMIAARFAERHRGGSRASSWNMLYAYSNIWNTNKKLFKDTEGNKILGQCPILEARQIIREEYGIKRHKPKRMVVKNHQLGRFLAELDRMTEGSGHKVWYTEEGVPLPFVAMTILLTKLSLFTGLRFNEARFLKWAYVDLEEGYFQLPGSIRRPKKDGDALFGDFDKNGKVHLNLDEHDFDFQGTKNGESHFVPMSTYVWALLRELHANRGDNPFVFSSTKDPGRPIKRHISVFQFIQCLGFDYSPHAARRTFASIANDVGIGYRDIKEMLNHVSESDVTSGYIVPGFNPTKNRHNFQKVCDHILAKHAQYLGNQAKATDRYDQETIANELARFVATLGLTPKEAVKILRTIAKNQNAKAA